MKIPENTLTAAMGQGFTTWANSPLEVLDLDSETIGGIAAASLEAAASLTVPVL